MGTIDIALAAPETSHWPSNRQSPYQSEWDLVDVTNQRSMAGIT
jgi:hypothetical protein